MPEVHVLTEDAAGLPAGTKVMIISQRADRCSVRSVLDGRQFEVDARLLGRSVAKDAPPADGVTVQSGSS